mgnify:CR=1 FL=1
MLMIINHMRIEEENTFIEYSVLKITFYKAGKSYRSFLLICCHIFL